MALVRVFVRLFVRFCREVGWVCCADGVSVFCGLSCKFPLGVAWCTRLVPFVTKLFEHSFLRSMGAHSFMVLRDVGERIAIDS